MQGFLHKKASGKRDMMRFRFGASHAWAKRYFILVPSHDGSPPLLACVNLRHRTAAPAPRRHAPRRVRSWHRATRLAPHTRTLFLTTRVPATCPKRRNAQTASRGGGRRVPSARGRALARSRTRFARRRRVLTPPASNHRPRHRVVVAAATLRRNRARRPARRSRSAWALRRRSRARSRAWSCSTRPTARRPRSDFRPSARSVVRRPIVRRSSTRNLHRRRVRRWASARAGAVIAQRGSQRLTRRESSPPTPPPPGAPRRALISRLRFPLQVDAEELEKGGKAPTKFGFSVGHPEHGLRYLAAETDASRAAWCAAIGVAVAHGGDAAERLSDTQATRRRSLSQTYEGLQASPPLFWFPRACPPGGAVSSGPRPV